MDGMELRLRPILRLGDLETAFHLSFLKFIETFELDFALAFLALDDDFFKEFFITLCFQYRVSLIAFIIWRDEGSTLGALEVAFSFEFTNINLEGILLN